MAISSVSNDLIKETAKLAQRKYRDETGKFLLEGFKAVEEACRAGVEIEAVFVLGKELDLSSEFGSTNPGFLPAHRQYIVTEAVMKKISTTDSVPQIAAVGRQKKYDKSVLSGAQKVVLLENIQDLGNLGTILRTSAAFGVDAIVLYGGADIYNPKCVRASAGNLWKVPAVSIKDFGELEELFAYHTRIATLPRAQTLLKDYTVTMPWLLMFGNEADGLSEELVNFAMNEVKIEMPGEVESLNLSVSCGIILYEILNS